MFNFPRVTLSNWHRKITMLAAVSSLSIAAPSIAATANFDSLATGSFGTSITDDGITFSNLIAGFRISPPEFIVRSFNPFNSAFSAPNYLTFGDSSLSNGNSGQNSAQSALGAFGSMTITPATVSQSVSLDVITENTGAEIGLFNDELVLQAFFQGNVVESVAFPFSNFSELNPSGQYLSSTLSLSGVSFDELQLFTPSSFADGVIPLAVDNVNITTLNSESITIQPSETVPESQPMTLLGLCLTGFLGYLVKKRTV